MFLFRLTLAYTLSIGALSVGIAGFSAIASAANSDAASPQISQAKGKAISNEERRKRIGQMVNDYALISGGWFVNQRCRILPEQATREFEWHATMLTRGLRRYVKPQTLAKARASAESSASSKKFEKCDKKAKKAVTDTLGLARRMSKSMIRQPYRSGFSEWKNYLRQFQNAAIRLNLERRCQVLNPSQRNQMREDFSVVELSLRKRTSENAVNKVLSDAAKLATAPCNEKSKTQIRNAAEALPQLRRRMVSAY
ncbi:MAG: hypothetical protein HOB79_16455 [Rhodospirillaceae bacterium]|nr:hypothetical protein [Rhodospirillaceae bacterium]MBT5034789.1 hypothetical protein [Rhodospirillaceae bacterium]MBT8003386.1 hypothetical protein [Rhodospirillales bacterium]